MTDVRMDPEAFLRDGGRLSMDEWVQLTDAEKVAFRRSQRVIRNEFAAAVAQEVFDMLTALGEDARLTEMVEKALTAEEDDG